MKMAMIYIGATLLALSAAISIYNGILLYIETKKIPLLSLGLTIPSLLGASLLFLSAKLIGKKAK